MTTTSQGYTIQSILTDNNNWEAYKVNHSVDPYVAKEVDKMLLCCHPSKGFYRGICPHCEKEVIMHMRCNSKVCSRCGRSYVDRWVEKAKKKLFKEQHRLVTLTLPADLRGVLEGRWDLLKIVQDSAHETLQIVASRTFRKKKVKIALLVGLQTYGQDMKFHPHLHCMMSEKVKYENGYNDLNYIPKEILRRVWRDVIVENLSTADINDKEKSIVYSMLQQYPNGFVTDVGRRSMNRREVVGYLARYMRHPAMANSRILFHGKRRVTIRMKDKLKREYSLWFPIDDFISRLLIHVAPKHFRVVRWYGLYSRGEVRLERKENERREIISAFIRDRRRVFRCPYCNNLLDEVVFVAYKPPGNERSGDKINYELRMAS